MLSTLGSWRSASFHSNGARLVPMVLEDTWYGGGAAWQFQSSTFGPKRMGKSMGKHAGTNNRTITTPGLQVLGGF